MNAISFLRLVQQAAQYAVSAILSRARPALIPYEQYQAWKATFNERPRTNLGKVGERLGEEFCRHFGIRDRKLIDGDDRMVAEFRIMTHYVQPRHGVMA